MSKGVCCECFQPLAGHKRLWQCAGPQRGHVIINDEGEEDLVTLQCPFGSLAHFSCVLDYKDRTKIAGYRCPDCRGEE